MGVGQDIQNFKFQQKQKSGNFDLHYRAHTCK